MANGLLGKFVKKRRIALDLTQRELASALGLKTSQFISNIERGLAHIPSSKVDEFAKILKVEPSELGVLVTESLKRKFQNKTEKYESNEDPFIDQFLCVWASASDNDRELIKNLVSRVLKIEE
jgi:transcriptional regulator with XRE-family HTH domain